MGSLHDFAALAMMTDAPRMPAETPYIDLTPFDPIRVRPLDPARLRTSLAS